MHAVPVKSLYGLVWFIACGARMPVVHSKVTVRVPVAKQVVESNDEVFFLIRYVPSFDSWPQIVQPSQPAALTTPIQPCKEEFCLMRRRLLWFLLGM